MLKTLLPIALCILISNYVIAQVAISDHLLAPTPDSTAVLDLQSNSRGFLPPRLTQSERNAIAVPADYLLIANTTAGCIQVYLPQRGWADVACDCQVNPDASFSIPSVSQNVAATFSANLSNAASYSWSFQGGTPASSTIQNPSVSWSSTGDYVVSLTVTDTNGCSSSSIDTVTVSSCIPTGTYTFNYTGAPQFLVAPSACGPLTFQCWGASGGNSTTAGGPCIGGDGGYATGEMTVTPGDTIWIYVGQQGSNSSGNTAGVPRAWNGGGAGGSSYIGPSQPGGAAGGGASDIRIGGQSLNDRVIVAAGGGGAAGGTSSIALNGGDGGGLTGDDSGPSYSSGTGHEATGATQVAGGARGTYNYSAMVGGQDGTFGQGGDGWGGGASGGGGGGGGWYGGGGGSTHFESGGGGGSSYIQGLTNSSTQSGQRTGNGQIIISW